MKKENEIKTVVPALRFLEFQGMIGWEKTYIYEECPNPYSGGTPKTTEKKYYGGNIPFIRSAEIGKDKTELSITQEGLNNSSAKMIQKGDLLIALYGANSGDIAISKIDGAINQAILCLKAKSNNLFIYYTLLKKQKDIVSRYLQGGQGNLSGEIIKSIDFYIPQEIEQQKIANCLSSLDDLIEATAQKVETLKEHKKGLMQRLFPAEGKNVPDLRFLEFQGAEEWKESSLDEYFDFKQGFQCPVEEQYDKQEHGMVRFIRIIDLTQPSTPYRYINDPGNQYYINKENLFMVRYGDPGLVGIGYEGIIANNLFQLIPKKKINPYFFYFLFSKEKTRIKGLSSSTSLSAINFTSLKALKIVVSQNTDEQQKIADCLSSIDELIEVISRKVEILKEHKKGLMQQLFPKI